MALIKRNYKYKKYELTKAQEKEIKRVVKNYNERIRYATKKYPESAELLPNKLTVAQVKKRITSENTYNVTVENITNWRYKVAKGDINFGNVKMPRSEYDKFMADVAKLNEIRKERRDRYEKYEYYRTKNGVVKNQRVAEMRQRMFPYIANKPKSREEFERMKRQVNINIIHDSWEKEASDYKEELLKAIEENFSDEHYRELKKYIDMIGANGMLHHYYVSGDPFDVEWYYSDPMDEDDKFEIAIAALKLVARRYSRNTKNKEEGLLD